MKMKDKQFKSLEETAGWDHTGSENEKFEVGQTRNMLDRHQGILEAAACSVDQLAFPRRM